MAEELDELDELLLEQDDLLMQFEELEEVLRLGDLVLIILLCFTVRGGI